MNSDQPTDSIHESADEAAKRLFRLTMLGAFIYIMFCLNVLFE